MIKIDPYMPIINWLVYENILSFSVALSGQNAHNSDEDIQCVHVDWNCTARESEECIRQS